MFTVYGAYVNSDQTEGRGPMVLTKSFSDRIIAVEYVEAQPDAWGRQREWRGNRYGDWELREQIVFESLDEAQGYDTHAARQRALAKLTDGDKRALGL